MVAAHQHHHPLVSWQLEAVWLAASLVVAGQWVLVLAELGLEMVPSLAEVPQLVLHRKELQVLRGLSL